MAFGSPSSRIHLFASTYGFDCSWVMSKVNCTPIEVGAARRSEDEIMYPLRDDTGDNISADNAYWGELTGIYWLWKNYDFKEGDIVGFCHYNKCLNADNKEVIRFIDKHPDGWVVMWATGIPSYTRIADGKEYGREELDALLDVMRESWPKYLSAWHLLHDGGGHSLGRDSYNCQLFYTGVGEFRRYCEFLFGVLTEVRRIIGDVERTPGGTRYCALLGERLLNTYLLANNCPIMEVERLALGAREPTVLGKAAKLLRINKRSHMYVSLRTRLRGPDWPYHGSYESLNNRYREGQDP